MAKSKPKQEPEYELKHRLTGAAIMVVFAVIVIPLLLKEPGIEANVATDLKSSGKKTFKTNIEPLNLNTLKLSQTEDDPGDDMDDLKPALLESEDVVASNDGKGISLSPKLNLTIDEFPDSQEGSKKSKKKKKKELTEEELAKRKEWEKKKSEEFREKLANLAGFEESQEKGKEIEKQPEPEKAPEEAAGADQVTQTTSVSGWTVRVGTFTKQKNVDSVSEKLNNSGFNTHHTSVETTLGKATRVWLGPYESKETAEKVSARLKSLIGEKGYVTKHAS